MAGNSCYFKSGLLNVFKSLETNIWSKYREAHVALIRSGRRLRRKAEVEEKELTEYFRKPYLGDGWSGKVVP